MELAIVNADIDYMTKFKAIKNNYNFKEGNI
jgi:hypothetical protein